MGVPPQEGGDRGEDQLDIHSRRTDRGPLPLARQHPTVGDVAVETGSEDEEHHPHLMALSPEVLARQAVAELVENLRESEGHGQPDPVARGKELLELRELGTEHVEVHEHQQQRARHQHGDSRQRGNGKKPAERGVDPVEDPVGIDPPESHRHDVGQPRHPLAPDSLPAALEQLRPLARAVADDEPTAVEGGHETGQFLDRDAAGGEAGLELLLEPLQARLAVEHVEEGILLGAEAEIAQRDRVFHDPPDLPLVGLPRGHEVTAPAQADGARGTRSEGIRGGGHGSGGSFPRKAIASPAPGAPGWNGSSSWPTVRP